MIDCGFAPVTGLANPTATIGLTAVNGSATTAMRSDAAPPLPAGVAANVLNAQTTNYTVATTDCGKTITLGGSAFYTVTVGAASSFSSTCDIRFVNSDTARGKQFAITGVTLGNENILWPGQSFTLRNENNTWNVSALPVRWQLTGATPFFVDPSLGSDTNDGLAAGSGAFATPGRAMFTACQALDLNSFAVTIFLAANTGYTTLPTCSFVGFQVSQGYGQLVITATPASVTTPVASPGVVNWTGHGLSNGNTVFFFVTGGSLPTGLTQGVPYFIINKATDTFQVSLTQGGAAINFTGSSTGTQTAIAPAKTVFTPGAQAAAVLAQNNTPFTVKGVQFTGCNNACVEVDTNGVIAIDAVDFGASTGNHIISVLAGSRIVFANDGYSVTGGASVHIQVNEQGGVYTQPGKTFAIAPITFSIYFLQALGNAYINLSGATYNGTATCTVAKADIQLGGGVDTGGVGQTLFPCTGTTNAPTNPGWIN